MTGNWTRPAKSPFVSVVIPTFNRAALLMEAIGSVLGQSYRDFELIVCDDGSTDDTATRLAELGPPVRHLRSPHDGKPGAARNRGIEAACGEFVALLDDDDVWDSEKLARQVACLHQGQHLNLVYTDRRVLTSDGVLSDPVHTPSPEQPEGLLALVLAGRMPFISTLLIRRDLLRLIGGFDEALATAEDLDLLLRLAPHARAAGVPEALVTVRRQAGSVSDRAGLLAFENALMVLLRWRANGALPSDHRQSYAALIAHLYRQLASTLARQGHFGRALLARMRALIER